MARTERSSCVSSPSANSCLVTRRHSRRATLLRCCGHEGIAGSGSGSLLFRRRLPGFPRSSFRLVGVGGGPGVFIRVTLLPNHFSFLSGESLPSRDCYVEKTGFQLDRVAAASE